MKLRLALACDLPELIALWQTVFDDDEGFIRAFYEASGIERTIVAEADDHIIGMVNCPEIELWTRSAQGDRRYRGAYVYALAVDSGYRGTGIGSALLDAAESGKYLTDLPQFLLLIPAETSLFGFYAKKGYDRAAYAPMIGSDTPETIDKIPLAHDSDTLYDRYIAACKKEAADGAVFVKSQPIFALSMDETVCYAHENGYLALDERGHLTEMRPIFAKQGYPKALWKALVDISTDISPIISRFMED